LQERLEKIREFINRIPNCYDKTEDCAFLIRSALALSVHAFYYEKFGLSVNIPSSLNDAIRDVRFKSAFFDRMMALADMQSVRITCNNIIHPTSVIAKYSADEMAELYSRLIKCINAIEEKANVEIIKSVSKQVFTKSVSTQTFIACSDKDDQKAKKIFDDAGLEENMFLYDCKGIREVVANRFNQPAQTTNAIMSARWIIPWFEKEIVWVVEMVKTMPDKQSNKWINVYLGNEIVEIPPKGKNTFGKDRIRHYAKKHPYRIAIEKSNGRLIVHGVYKFDDKKSVNDLAHYYIKI
jgi:hypothetical protein